MNNDIWVFVHVSAHGLDDSVSGLIGEGRRLADALSGRLTVAALGPEAAGEQLEQLSHWGAQRTVFLCGVPLEEYNGELFAKILCEALAKETPRAVLFAQGPQSLDLAARLGALLETAVVTSALDASIADDGSLQAVRPIENGYLFDTLAIGDVRPALINFLPAVLTPPPARKEQMAIETVQVSVPVESLKTRTLEYIEADPATLDIEEADIIVAAGRGVGKGESVALIHQLAEVIGGSVAGTRPVIDWHLMPFERQIGQTGKTVTPRLIINCGISGANEYTAGIEKSQRVIAINTDPRARIFRFADLGVVADVHQLLPLLVERLKEVVTDDAEK
jgi:electron transfer flavoprotein alpha subunit